MMRRAPFFLGLFGLLANACTPSRADTTCDRRTPPWATVECRSTAR